MDASIISALAALAGATIGGFTSIVGSWLIQHAQTRSQHHAHSQGRREELYKEFIEGASKLYIDALQNDKANVSDLMGLYAKVSRMRVLSSAPVVDIADQILKEIIDKYLEPNKTFPELSEMVKSGLVDPLRKFSEANRAEFQADPNWWGPQSRDGRPFGPRYRADY
jgi:hypothetical protein